MSDDEPRRVGRYVVLERLGQGGMGVVYRAYDPDLDRRVALKLLRADRLGTTGSARLMREAQAIASLAHPNVVAVFDVGRTGDEVFVAMELVDGVRLDHWREAAPRSRAELLDVFVQAGRGLAAAHAAGIVHRDFTPANVLVGSDGRVRVLDFGIARRLGDDDPAPASPSPPSHDKLTAAGFAIGTPLYMSPEQHRGEAADARSDQFSFCLALYEALYGERPFATEEDDGLGRTDALALATLKAEVRPPRPGTRVPARLRRLLLRGLALAPDARFATMESLLAELARDPWRPWRRAGVVATFAALTAALAVAALRPGAAAEVCRGGGARMAAVWNEGRRRDVRAALAATGVPFAADASARLVQLLDARAATWSSMHREACEATRVRREQSEELLDKRMGCFEARLAELRQLVELAASADASFAENAVRAAENLPELAVCADRRGLGALRPLPADPTRRARVAALFTTVGAANALSLASRHAQARAVLLPALVEIEALAYPPLAAQALDLLGYVAWKTDDLALARAAYEEAVIAAEAGGDDRTKARAESDLIAIVGSKMVQREEGLLWARRAEATIARLGGDDRLEAGRLYQLTMLLRELGRGEESVALARREVALLERAAVDPDDAQLARARFDLASALRRFTGQEEALALNARALASVERRVGRSSPEVVVYCRQRGDVLKELGRLEEAIATYEHCADVARRATGPQSSLSSLALRGLGDAYAMSGRYADAEKTYLGVLDIMRAHFGTPHPYAAALLGQIGNTYFFEGRFTEALAMLDRARDEYLAAGEPDNPDLGISESNAGEALRALRRPREALARFERARDLWRRLGKDNGYQVSALNGMGRALIDLGEVERALPLLEEARAAGLNDADPALADTYFGLALALERSDPERALRSAEEALKRMRAAGPRASRDAAEVAAWIARFRRPQRADRIAR